jgi:stage III sporulation protein AC
MDIEIILKIAGIGILTAVINQVLKHCGKEEIATFTTLASVMLVFFLILEMMSDLFSEVKTIFGLY